MQLDSLDLIRSAQNFFNYLEVEACQSKNKKSDFGQYRKALKNVQLSFYTPPSKEKTSEEISSPVICFTLRRNIFSRLKEALFRKPLQDSDFFGNMKKIQESFKNYLNEQERDKEEKEAVFKFGFKLAEMLNIKIEKLQKTNSSFLRIFRKTQRIKQDIELLTSLRDEILLQIKSIQFKSKSPQDSYPAPPQPPPNLPLPPDPYKVEDLPEESSVNKGPQWEKDLNLEREKKALRSITQEVEKHIKDLSTENFSDSSLKDRVSKLIEEQSHFIAECFARDPYDQFKKNNLKPIVEGLVQQVFNGSAEKLIQNLTREILSVCKKIGEKNISSSEWPNQFITILLEKVGESIEEKDPKLGLHSPSEDKKMIQSTIKEYQKIETYDPLNKFWSELRKLIKADSSHPLYSLLEELFKKNTAEFKKLCKEDIPQAALLIEKILKEGLSEKEKAKERAIQDNVQAVFTLFEKCDVSLRESLFHNFLDRLDRAIFNISNENTRQSILTMIQEAIKENVSVSKISENPLLLYKLHTCWKTNCSKDPNTGEMVENHFQDLLKKLNDNISLDDLVPSDLFQALIDWNKNDPQSDSHIKSSIEKLLRIIEEEKGALQPILEKIIEKVLESQNFLQSSENESVSELEKFICKVICECANSSKGEKNFKDELITYIYLVQKEILTPQIKANRHKIVCGEIARILEINSDDSHITAFLEQNLTKESLENGKQDVSMIFFSFDRGWLV